MPDIKVRFSWDLELADVDNDADLDVLVSCKRCGGSYLFRNDGAGTFTDDPRALPQYTNNYEFEPMDLDGDGFLDLVTINDGEIVGGNRLEPARARVPQRRQGPVSRRDRGVVAAGAQRRRGRQHGRVPRLRLRRRRRLRHRLAERSRSPVDQRRPRPPDRARWTCSTASDTPGTLGIALADLDGDGRMDVVQGQGEHKTAIDERVFCGPRPCAPTRRRRR